jgi:tRNA(Arg) A34 adenosine deaminase TadA
VQVASVTEARTSHRTSIDRSTLPDMRVDARRRDCLIALPLLLLPRFGFTSPALQRAMQRARTLRDEALRDGDQPFGAVVLRGDEIVGEGPSRVIVANDPTAHAEMEAIRDASRRLRSRDLSGCLLVSTSRPCRMCEAAASWARISRMVHGDALIDAGPPS